jgi:hypothetical protein
MLENERFAITRDADGKRVYVADPHGTLYAPWSAKDGIIAELDVVRAAEAAHTNLCSGCGRPFDGGVHVFIQEAGKEPPLHPRCAKYALRACPHLARTMTHVYIASYTEIEFDDDQYDADGTLLEEGIPHFAPGEDVRYVPIETFLDQIDELDSMSGDDAVKKLCQDEIDEYRKQNAA